MHRSKRFITKDNTGEALSGGLVDNVMGHQRVTHIHMALSMVAVMGMGMVMMIMEAMEEEATVGVVGAWEVVALEVACLS
jgi:hypothetical protein